MGGPDDLDSIFRGWRHQRIGHYWGYRNYDAPDASTNISPWGILIGGEELHNNHHTHPTSAKFALRWFEFDIGWVYIRAMQAVGLAKVLPRGTRAEGGRAQARRRSRDAAGGHRQSL